MVARLDILKHAAVFLAAVALVWLAGVLPGMFLPPRADSAATMPAPASAGDLIAGVLAVWPLFVALAIAQALTFNYVKKWATPAYLSGVFVLAFLLAWRYATA